MPASDPAEFMRSKNFVVVLVFAAVIGVVVSFVGWAFLEAVHRVQVWVFQDLPSGLGFDSTPSWWGVPVCAIAGVPVAVAVAKMHGHGGHVPANGLQPGATQPVELPGVVLAALATLGLGLVLGPEAPLLAIGSGVAIACVSAVKRDAPPTLGLVLGAAGSFAAISMIFGSPVLGAIIIIEASGLGGATLPLILLPGLIAAGIGSLVFIGMAHWTGLSTTAYALPALHLPAIGTPNIGEIGWAIAIGVAAALITYPVRQLGLRTLRLVSGREFVVIPIVGLVVGLLALVFAHWTSASGSLVLFSGQDSLPTVINNATAYSVGTMLILLLCKGIAWGACLGSFRGGPTFPAIFLGVAGGVAASHLPGLPLGAAVPVAMGAMFVAFLRLPLSAVVVAAALTLSAGHGVDPLIIVGVVVAYVATLALDGKLGAGEPAPASSTA
jgi:H+/Cl- antiporter ClcA